MTATAFEPGDQLSAHVVFLGAAFAKESVLTEQRALAQYRRTTSATDPRNDWAVPLIDVGHQNSEPTAWLVEGLLIYLPPDEARCASRRHQPSGGNRASAVTFVTMGIYRRRAPLPVRDCSRLGLSDEPSVLGG